MHLAQGILGLGILGCLALGIVQCGAKQPKVSDTFAADPSNYHSRPNAPCQDCHAPDEPHNPKRGPCGTCHSYPDWAKIK